MVEYEALILGLQIIRKLGGQIILVMGDSELGIKQINAEYSIHNPRLARYRDTTHDLVEDLLESKFAIIPRKHNMQAHCLATFASTCKFPFSPIQKYTVEIKHRPIILDNVKYQQIFSEDEQIYHFLNNEREFQNFQIDNDCNIDSPCNIDSIFFQIDDLDVHNFDKPTIFTQSDIDEQEKVDIEEMMEDEPDLIDLKHNILPKGLTPLEDLFDSNDVLKRPKMVSVRSDIEEYNLGKNEKPKMIKL